MKRKITDDELDTIILRLTHELEEEYDIDTNHSLSILEELKTLRDVVKIRGVAVENLQRELNTLREHRNYASEFLSEKEKRERYENTIKEALEKWDTGFDVKHILQCALKGF